MRSRPSTPVLLAVLLGGWATGHTQVARDYLQELGPETENARVLRHDRVAARRRGPVVMVHRGASAMAPENTLLAYARAMDHGADGVEVDVRRTADGVLVLFHDEVLDRLTHGIGAVRHVTARELLALEPRSAFGRPLGGTPPSFVQLLDLARQRAMLLHLDLKEPGLEAEIARWLEAADCWEHVVSVNLEHAARLSAHSLFRPLRYKAPGLYPYRHDLDPERVEAALRQPGEMILVDDPRVAVRVLGRQPYQPVVLSQVFLYTRQTNAWLLADDPAPFNPMAHLARLRQRVDPDRLAQLIALIEGAPPAGGAEGADGGPAQRHAARIVERAWAADRLGQRGRKQRVVVQALERLVREPTPHPDWHYDALDGALAARALGQLRAIESAAVLIEALRRAPAETNVGAALPQSSDPASWGDARLRLHLMTALGDLRCRRARRFLLDYVALDEAGARAFGPPFFIEATRGLLRQNLAWDGIARLLRSANPSVRGTALLECLDGPNEERRLAVAKAARWAIGLPRAPATMPNVHAARLAE